MRNATKMKFASTGTCKQCGKLYTYGTPGSGYKYCSRACAKKAQWAQVEKWQAEHNIDLQDWLGWYRWRKFQDKLEEYEETNF